jgi:hypothetical protein
MPADRSPSSRRPAHAALAAAAMLLLAVAEPGAAQVTDSARTGVRAPRAAAPDSIVFGVRRVSPRNAFLRSLAVPGWGQTSLDRGVAGGIFVMVEAMSAAFIIKSKRDLDRAKDARSDSVFVGWERDEEGNTVWIVDPVTGDSMPSLQFARNPLAQRIKARRQHLEDWIALLIFNHLFSGADAFVAAHLSDLPPRISVRRDERGAMRIGATVTW